MTFYLYKKFPSKTTNGFDSIECKCFTESDVSSELCSIPDAERSSFENTAEWLAFVLVERGNNEWGTYYGPLCKKTDNTYFPPREMITDDIITYWEKGQMML